jgi:hypothetical protein
LRDWTSRSGSTGFRVTVQVIETTIEQDAGVGYDERGHASTVAFSSSQSSFDIWK